MSFTSLETERGTHSERASRLIARWELCFYWRGVGEPGKRSPAGDADPGLGERGVGMGRGNEVVVLVELDEVGWFAMRPSETAPDRQSGQRRAAAEPTASVERRSMAELAHRRDEDPAFEGTPR